MDTGFVKRNAAAPAGFFEYEAAGLRWLAKARPAGGPPVAEVLEVVPGSITVRRLTPVAPTAAAAERLGQQLAAMHAVGVTEGGAVGAGAAVGAASAGGVGDPVTAFGALPSGWTGPGFIGRQRLPVVAGEPIRRWGQFYAELRLAPFARSAHARGNLSDAGRLAVDRVCERLAGGDFDDDRGPARLHGDLWAGNVVYAREGATLIDPSAHGGHGQSDLAMLQLFGLPGLGRVEAAYAEAADLPGDWWARTGLHQLYPLLVHATSHGRSYGVEAERIAGRYT